MTPDLRTAFAAAAGNLRCCAPRPLLGQVVGVRGGAVEARIGGVRVGELCRLHDPGMAAPLEAEVVAIRERLAVLAPVGGVAGLSTRAVVEPTGRGAVAGVGDALLGRVLDGFGRPADGLGPLPPGLRDVPVEGSPPAPLDRAPVRRALPTGLRAVDALLTCAEGQRVGVFGPPGSGKTSFLGRLVRGADAEVFVLALVGERGREVREFVDRLLDGGTGARSVVVSATSDRPALERVRAAQVATAIAEGFRDQGRRVLLVVDSVTRLARAWREVGLAALEPPTRRGFPSSVFAHLPRLLERSGPGARGAITAFYTVLQEGDPAGDVVAEEVKSLLDGHLVLSASLAEAGHHPAIDVLASLSRTMERTVSAEHRDAASKLRRLLARHAEVEFLVRVGEYRTGTDPLADEAIAKIEAIRAFLRQADPQPAPFRDSVARLASLAFGPPP